MIEAEQLHFVRHWLGQIPAFSAERVGRAGIKHMPGLTNVVYRIEMDHEIYCLRIPGKGTSYFIDRPSEAKSVQIATGLGISPEAIYVNEITGLMLTRYIEGAVTMSQDRFRLNQDNFDAAVRLLHRLHFSGAIFDTSFDVFLLIDRYLSAIDRQGAIRPPICRDIAELVPRLQQALAPDRVSLVPCHCDPICENFIADANRMWLVDWEYSGMNDPMWDIADFLVEAAASTEQEQRALSIYFGRSPTPSETTRIEAYKILSELLWGLWGLMRQEASTEEIDYRAYGLRRLERFVLRASEKF